MALSTIASYPNRGQYGKSNYRGNCSGLLIKDVLEFFKPKKVFDPMCGSGTTGQVAEDLGIDCLELDLHKGFDLLNDDIPESSDFIFWHPPYWDIIRYSGEVWGQQPDPRDLSQIPSYWQFMKALNDCQLRLMSSLRKGGHLAILVGDIKKQGQLYSMSHDMDRYGKPVQNIIKTQNNCFSDRQNYSGRFIPIVHETLVILKRDRAYLLPTRKVISCEIDLRQQEKITWRDVVYAALWNLGAKASLKQLYQEIDGHIKTEKNPFWKEKIRQVLQKYSDFKNIAHGTWILAS